jgi:hypothetical protein
MSLLNRADGVQFVVQPYRERIAVSKRRTMVQRIRLLSEQHGQYVALSLLSEAAIEAVFSKESGYLLGESVWSYFNKSAYLIFCERLSKENNQVLVVVIRNNEVYLDMLIENDKLRAELLPLMTLQESYRVITYGEVALKQTEAPGCFVLPKNLVSSFEIAKEPVLKNLPILPTARLLTLTLALKSSLLGSRMTPTMIAVSTLVILAVIGWIYVINPPVSQPVAINTTAAQEQVDNGYLDFYAAMHSPSPVQQINELVQTIQTVAALPGWPVDTVTYTGNQYQIALNRQGGALQWLTQWVKHQNYALNLAPAGAQLVAPSQLATRSRPKVLYPLSQITASLVDQLDTLFPEEMVNISDVRSLGQTKARTITVNFTNASPDTLILIGDTLGDNLPLEITAMNVSMNSGLLNGNVQLSVWGV